MATIVFRLRRMARIKLAAVVLLLGMASCESTTPIRKDQAWGQEHYQRLISMGKPTEVSGTIRSLGQVVLREEKEPGVRLNLDVDGKEMDVHLGPRSFVLQHDIYLTNGKPLTVAGIKINLEDRPTLIAREVSQEGRRIVLRDPSGYPRWATPIIAKSMGVAEKQAAIGSAEGEDFFEVLHVFDSHCAGCHQTDEPPGSLFLKKEHLSEPATIDLLTQALEKSPQVTAHADFRKSSDGKKVLEWLKKQHAETSRPHKKVK